MHKLQFLYSKILASLFVPIHDNPAKEKKVHPKALFQQPQSQLLSPALWRKRQRHCQLLLHKLHQRISCTVHPRSAESIPSCIAIPTTREFSFLTSSSYKKNLLSVCQFVWYFLRSSISISICVSLLCMFVRTQQLSSLGGLCFRMHMFMFVCICLWLCGAKLYYLVFVYGFENLMKINWVLFSIYENAK